MFFIGVILRGGSHGQGIDVVVVVVEGGSSFSEFHFDFGWPSSMVKGGKTALKGVQRVHEELGASE